ncbi:MAG: 3'-5' exonuclease domain-containing protein 2 [Prevotellaceae bacterium]|nr:3'-5' exonuclease domain-containing protein 2 [Prevotellaceae bacterium]
MIIPESIDKIQLTTMPRASYQGEIYVIDNEREAEKAVRYLLQQPLVGIDSETRPSFQKGCQNKVALLQVATNECCFLFRLNKLGFTPSIVRFLESAAPAKVGLSLRDDFFMLHKREDFKPGNCIELQEYVNRFGIKDRSLQKIYAILFREKISKSQRLTNWDSSSLTEPQKLYAAMDAWACLRIYVLLENLRRTGEYAIIPVANENDKNNDSHKSISQSREG